MKARIFSKKVADKYFIYKGKYYYGSKWGFFTESTINLYKDEIDIK